ncbi:unnamed protein product [Adineta steineri]|uniref:Uncharacterized protein n=1 Tax=Adineta steineri TaxID=433720 RepID=A0A813XT35_9BILA|nr:unnamed protein product [Adineta steineri]CAF0869715.1 unnamed protein product [Adineta steineri]CAF1015118.1 unnamed protein product [Adineta steineri]
MSTVGMAANKTRPSRTTNESAIYSSQEEQRNANNLERYRQLSAKVERCMQELVERIYEKNPTLNFELLAPPPAHLASSSPNDNKEYFFDFYLVWKNPGKIQVERDASSVCCKIKYLNRSMLRSRAEQDRLLISNIDKKKFSYLNGRGLRDLFFETLHTISPDLVRIDFIEYLIYFDLIIPAGKEKTTCHVTLLPCIHLREENEVLLPFGTLRWYPRSLISSNENNLFNCLQQPLQNVSIRRYMSTTDNADTSAKYTRQDQQAFARMRTIIHELLSSYMLEHIDNMDQIRLPFDDDFDETKKIFFLPHETDRNCNVFPAGQYLLDDLKAKRFFKRVLQTNIKIPTNIPVPVPIPIPIDNNDVKV